MEHISGTANIWADLLSRWQENSQASLLSLSAYVPAKHDSDFQWPSLEEILEAQNNLEVPLEVPEGRIWVPTKELQLRIMIIGHTSEAGHRGAETTSARITEYFWWYDMKKDVQDFLQNVSIVLQT